MSKQTINTRRKSLPGNINRDVARHGQGKFLNVTRGESDSFRSGLSLIQNFSFTQGRTNNGTGTFSITLHFLWRDNHNVFGQSYSTESPANTQPDRSSVPVQRHDDKEINVTIRPRLTSGV